MMDQIFQAVPYSSYVEQSEFIENQLLSQLGNSLPNDIGRTTSSNPLENADASSIPLADSTVIGLASNLPADELTMPNTEKTTYAVPSVDAPSTAELNDADITPCIDKPNEDRNGSPQNDTVGTELDETADCTGTIKATYQLEVKSPEQLNTEMCLRENELHFSAIHQSDGSHTTVENGGDYMSDIEHDTSSELNNAESILPCDEPNEESYERKRMLQSNEPNETSDPHDSSDDSIPKSDLDNHSDQSFDDDASNYDQSENISNDNPQRKRRRIRLLNVAETDNSNSDDDYNERARILESPPHVLDATDDEDLLQQQAIEKIVINERPGPKSKKASTRILKELEVRALLRNAVVIPVPGTSDSKKRANRILDSDEELEIDDTIGMNSEGIGPPEAIELESIGESNPEHADNMDPSTNDGAIMVAQLEPMCILECGDDENPPSGNGSGVAKRSPHNALEVSAVRDSGNSTDSAYHQASIQHKRASQLVSTVQVIPAQLSSCTDDEDVPNDVYFGSADHANRGVRVQPYDRPGTSGRGQRGRGRGKRGRPSHTPVPVKNGRINRQSSRSSSSESDSASSSDGFDAQRYNNQKSKSSYAQNVDRSQQQQQRLNGPIRPAKANSNRKKDRFYDKSREIPNDVYFGDVNVPLHVLHSYGKHGSSDDELVGTNLPFARPLTKTLVKEIAKTPTRGRGRGRGSSHIVSRPPAHSIAKKRKPATPSGAGVGGGGDTLISEMKELLRAAGLKHDKFKYRWEGYSSRQDRANKMLELLYENGLEGEATIANCRQLRKLNLAKKEIEELDTSLIIATEGRITRRSVREAKKLSHEAAASAAAEEEEEPENDDNTHDTLVRLRNVIDSESDFD